LSVLILSSDIGAISSQLQGHRRGLLFSRDQGIMSTQPESINKKTRKGDLRLPLPVTVKLDPDVEAVLAFMQENFKASKLVDIANGVKELAEPLWNHHKTEPGPCEKRFIAVYLTIPSTS